MKFWKVRGTWGGGFARFFRSLRRFSFHPRGAQDDEVLCHAFRSATCLGQ